MWAQGASPWRILDGTTVGVCRVDCPFVYPGWTMPAFHLALSGVDPVQVAMAVFTLLEVAALALVLLWARWARVTPALVVAVLVLFTRFGDRWAIGATTGNLEPWVALALAGGAIAWSAQHTRIGPALMGVAVAVKPDHAPWLLAVGWALGDVRRGALALAATAGVLVVTDPLVLGADSFGWVRVALRRGVAGELGGASTLSMLREALPTSAVGPAWVCFAGVVLALTARAGRSVSTASPEKLLLAWLAVLLLLPRVKDYVWVTAYGPLLAAWWLQPWSLLSVPVGEAVWTVSPDHATWVETALTWAILAARLPAGRVLALDGGATLAADEAARPGPQTSRLT